jgi:ketosteroid isomerase-like protein
MTADSSEVPGPSLAQFEAAQIGLIQAFNRHDLAATFALLPSDCEWEVERFPYGGGKLVGPDRVRRFYEEVLDSIPDWSVEALGFFTSADGAFVGLYRGHGTGRASGASVTIEFGDIYELRGWTPVRVHQYPDWEQALSVAGLDPALAAEVRWGGHNRAD